MIAALICVVSMAVLSQLTIAHFRSIIASSRRVVLSARVREITGIESDRVAADDFARLVQLVRLCPEQGDDQAEIRAVGTYYRLLNLVSRLSRPVVPGVAAWANQERQSCSYFAAVALDRRISYSQHLFTQQVADRL
jgi:hypothetical protein